MQRKVATMDVDFAAYNIGMERGGVVVLKQYEKLKDTLAVIYASERDKYTSAKDALVQTLLREAQAWKQATDPNTRLPVSR